MTRELGSGLGRSDGIVALHDVPGSAALLDWQGTVVCANERWLAAACELGPPLAAVGASFPVTVDAVEVSGPSGEPVSRRVQHVLAGRADGFAVLYRRDVRGTTRWGHLAVSRRGAPGEVGAAMVLHTEMTQELAAAQDAGPDRLALDGVEATRLLATGQLAVTLAHELNQPLTAVANYIEACLLLLSGAADGAPERLTRALQLAGGQVGRAVQIIRRVGDLILRGKLEKRPEILDTILAEAIVLAEAGRERAAEIRAVLDPNVGLVPLNRVQIQLVAVNLIRNAIEAVQGMPQRVVTVRSVASASKVEVIVADSGRGLDPDVAGRLFKPFVTTKGGMGWGLSICRTLVEAHGGRIWAEPGKERGAEFHFTLPLGDLAVASPVRPQPAAPDAHPPL